MLERLVRTPTPDCRAANLCTLLFKLSYLNQIYIYKFVFYTQIDWNFEEIGKKI